MQSDNSINLPLDCKSCFSVTAVGVGVAAVDHVATIVIQVRR